MLKKLLFLMIIFSSLFFSAETLGTSDIASVVDPTLTLTDPTLIHSPDYASFSLDCSICEDLSTYSESNLLIIPDSSSRFQIALSNSSRNPVQYAPVIVEVNSSGTKTYYTVYTNSSGLARFDFSSYNSSCADFTILYCYNFNNACSLSKCFGALGYSPDDPGIPTAGDLSLPSGTSRPTSLQNPNRLKSSLKTYRYCPPPPDLRNQIPPFCFPLVLILSLLFGGLYLSGRNPFLGFDLSTPRVGKHIKYTANQRNIYRVDTQGIANAGIRGASAIKNPSVTRAREREDIRYRGVLSGVLGSMQMGVRGAQSGLATRTQRRAQRADTVSQNRRQGGTAIDVRRAANREASQNFFGGFGRDNNHAFLGDLVRSSSLGRAVSSVVDSVRQGGPTTTTGSRILSGVLAFLQFTPFGGLLYHIRIASDAFSIDKNMSTALANLRGTRATTDHNGYRYEISFNERGEAVITRSRIGSQGNLGSPERVQLNSIPIEVSRNFAGVVVPALERYNRSAAFHYQEASQNASERLLSQITAALENPSRSVREDLRNSASVNDFATQLRIAAQNGDGSSAIDLLLNPQNRQNLAALESILGPSAGNLMASAYASRLNEISATYSNQQAVFLSAISGNPTLDANTLAYFQQSLIRANDFFAQSSIANNYSALASAYGANNISRLQQNLLLATELTGARGDRDLAFATALYMQSRNPNAPTTDVAALTTFRGVNLDNNSLDSLDSNTLGLAREHLRFVSFTLGAFESNPDASAARFNAFSEIRSDLSTLLTRDGSNALIFERALSQASQNAPYDVPSISNFLHRAAQTTNEADLHTVEVQFVLDQRRLGSEIGRRSEAISHMDRNQFNLFVENQLRLSQTTDPGDASLGQIRDQINGAWEHRNNSLQTQIQAREEFSQAQAELIRLSNPNSQVSGALNQQEHDSNVAAAQARVAAATEQLNLANNQFNNADRSYCDATARFFARGISPTENPFEQYAQTHLSSSDYNRYTTLASANQGLFDQRTDPIRAFNVNYAQQMYIEHVGPEQFYQRLASGGVEIPENIRTSYAEIQQMVQELPSIRSPEDLARAQNTLESMRTALARDIAFSSIPASTLSQVGGFGQSGNAGESIPPFDPVAATNAYVRDRYIAVADDRARALTELTPNQMMTAIEQMHSAETAAINRSRQNDPDASATNHQNVYNLESRLSRDQYESLRRSYDEYVATENRASANPNDSEAISRRDSARENFVFGFQAHMSELGSRSLYAIDGPHFNLNSGRYDPTTTATVSLDTASASTSALTTFLSGSGISSQVRDAFYRASANVPISLGSDAMRTFQLPLNLTSQVPDFARVNNLGSTSVSPNEATAQMIASMARPRP